MAKRTTLNRRLQLSIPRLDYLLGGGFIEGGVYMIRGNPGTGKTIFGSQICFEKADQGKNSLFISLLTESTGKIIGYLEPFKFFKDSHLASKVFYESGYGELRSSGLVSFFKMIKREITRLDAKILVIDGVDFLLEYLASTREYSEFMHSLQQFAQLSKCTVFLLSSNINSSRGKVSVEEAITDGVIDLIAHEVGPRSIKEIQVKKFRGSSFLEGRHEFEINAETGFTIHPRTEVHFQVPFNDENEKRTRVQTGIKKLDDILHGGFLSGSATSLVGAPGTGKTTLGLMFLAEGARRGQHGIYFGFYESPSRLISKAENLGIPLKKYIDQGLIEIQWQQGVENIADALVEKLLERIRAKREKQIRVFIDGLSGFRRALPYPDRFGTMYPALTNELRRIGATTIFSDETDIFSSDIRLPNRELGSVVDNVILLRYIELRSQIHRLISILKVRESAYDSSIREFIISSKGIEVKEIFESTEAILTGHARIKDDKSVKKTSGSTKSRKARK